MPTGFTQAFKTLCKVQADLSANYGFPSSTQQLVGKPHVQRVLLAIAISFVTFNIVSSHI